MNRTKWMIAMAAIVVLTFALGGALFSRMPLSMASHWNAAGAANGYMSRFWGIFLLPLISLGLLGLFLVIPKIDPLKSNIEKFINFYYGFVVLFLVYFLYIYTLTLLWNLDFRFDMTRALLPAVGVLFFFIGIMVSKSKRNYFIGIRTPWTLANDEVWNRTHRLGGLLFKITGIVSAIVAIFVSEPAIWVLLGLALATTVITLVYSYVVYRRLERAGKLDVISHTPRS
jgi:uncharacterized membrane protein